jgi:hypothetical protein
MRSAPRRFGGAQRGRVSLDTRDDRRSQAHRHEPQTSWQEGQRQSQPNATRRAARSARRGRNAAAGGARVFLAPTWSPAGDYVAALRCRAARRSPSRVCAACMTCPSIRTRGAPNRSHAVKARGGVGARSGRGGGERRRHLRGRRARSTRRDERDAEGGLDEGGCLLSRGLRATRRGEPVRASRRLRSEECIVFGQRRFSQVARPFRADRAPSRPLHSVRKPPPRKCAPHS